MRTGTVCGYQWWAAADAPRHYYSRTAPHRDAWYVFAQGLGADPDYIKAKEQIAQELGLRVRNPPSCSPPRG